MADYDWFRPSQAELDKQAEKAQWEKENKVSPQTTSTAVGTKFYNCHECGAVLVHANWAVAAHRSYIHPSPVEGKHRD